MTKFYNIFLLLMSSALISCSQGSDSCGGGTHKEGGSCVPDAVTLVVTQPAIGGTITGSPQGSYGYGSKIVLTFSPTFGYEWKGWVGADCPEAECVVTLTNSKNVSAIVEAVPYSITLDPASFNFATNTCSLVTYNLKNISQQDYSSASPTNIYLSGASSLEFYTDENCSSLISSSNALILPAGSSGASFYVKSNTTGGKSFNLKAGNTNFSKQFNFFSEFTLDPLALSLLATETLQFSSSGNGVGNLIYSILSGGGVIDYTGKFTAPPYRGISKIRLTDSVTNLFKEAIITVEPMPNTVIYPGIPSFFEVDSCNAVPFQIRDLDGQSLLSGLNTPVALSSSDDVSFFLDSNCQTNATSLNIAAGLSGGTFYAQSATRGLKTFKFKTGLIDFDKSINFFNALKIAPLNDFVYATRTKQFSTSGGVGTLQYSTGGDLGEISVNGLYRAPTGTGVATIIVTDSITLRSSQTSLQVVPLPNSVIFSGIPAYAEIDSCVPVNYLIKDSNNNNIFSAIATPINLSSATGVTFFSDPACSDQISSTFLPIQTSSSVFYIKSLSTGVRSFNFSITDTAVNSNQGLNFRDPLILTPVNTFVLATKTKQFTTQNGLGSISYSVISGGGSINSAGLYTASENTGVAVIKALDTVTNISKQVNLTIEPLASRIDLSSLGTYGIVNSCLPVIYTVKDNKDVNINSGISNDISFINANDITFYTDSACSSSVNGITLPAGSSTGTFYIKGSATGVRNFTSVINPAVNFTRSVNFYNELFLSPDNTTILTTQTKQFIATGGLGTPQFQIISGSGSINSSGMYTAGTSRSLVRIRATDPTTSAFKEVSLNVEPLPSAISFTVAPSNAPVGNCNLITVLVKDNLNNNINSGISTNVTLSTTSSIGFFNDSSCSSAITSTTVAAGSSTSSFYMKGGIAETGSFTATVSPSVNASKSVIFYNPLVISPQNSKIYVSNSLNFTTTGGIPPYTYSVASGLGSINSSSGVYSATVDTDANIKVTDSIGNFVSTNLKVANNLSTSASYSVVTRSMVALLATGGFPPYSYAVISGNGSIDLTGVYSAPPSSGSAVVRITDSNNSSITTNIVIVDPLLLDPMNTTVLVSSSKQFTASGGLAPYTFSIVSGNGTISSTGLYTASAVPVNAVIKVTDSMNNQLEANIQVIPQFNATPTSANVFVGNNLQVAASGGLPPYTYLITSGTSSIDSSGLFVAAASPEAVTIVVSDSSGLSKTLNWNVIKPLQISPPSLIIPINGTQQFSASFGLPPYNFSIASGNGTINSTSGIFQAPSTQSVTVVKVADSAGQEVTATVQVIQALSVLPTNGNVISNSTFQINATGGLTPYVYQILSGGGSVNQSSGVYTPRTATETVQVQVTDSLNQSQTIVINVYEPLEASVSSLNIFSGQSITISGVKGKPSYSYSLTTNGGIGSSINATSGLYTAGTNSTNNPIAEVIRVQDVLNQTVLIPVNVYKTFTVTGPSGIYQNQTAQFTAAGGILGSGSYTYQVSGVGSINSSGLYTAPATVASTQTVTITIEDNATPTKNSIVKTLMVYPALSVSPTSVTLGGNASQVFTVTGGSGSYQMVYSSGSTALGSSISGLTYTSGSSSGTESLLVSSVGVSGTVTISITVNAATISQVIAGYNNACVILSDSSVKCLGNNNVGQLGRGTTGSTDNTLGYVKMPDNSIFKASALAIGSQHICAIRKNTGQADDGFIFCWGSNSSAQACQDTTTTSVSNPTKCPYQITPRPQSPFFLTYGEIKLGVDSSCAGMSDGSYACWGSNQYGQLGSRASVGGSVAPEFEQVWRSQSGSTNLIGGYGLYSGNYHYCLKNGHGNSAAVCWGRNDNGQLGDASGTSRPRPVTLSFNGRAVPTSWSCETGPFAQGCFYNDFAGTGGDQIMFGYGQPGKFGGPFNLYMAGNNNTTSYSLGDSSYSGAGVLSSAARLVGSWSGRGGSYPTMGIGNGRTCFSDGSGIFCWGLGGFGTGAYVSFPSGSSGMDFESITSGGGDMMCLKDYAGTKIWCWRTTTDIMQVTQ